MLDNRQLPRHAFAQPFWAQDKFRVDLQVRSATNSMQRWDLLPAGSSGASASPFFQQRPRLP